MWLGPAAWPNISGLKREPSNSELLILLCHSLQLVFQQLNLD